MRRPRAEVKRFHFCPRLGLILAGFIRLPPSLEDEAFSLLFPAVKGFLSPLAKSLNTGSNPVGDAKYPGRLDRSRENGLPIH